MSMSKIRPRPISQLTPAMGFVLLIGKSNNDVMPTRAVTGRKTDHGTIVTIDGAPFACDARAAGAFIEIPYDQEAAAHCLAPPVSREVEDLYLSLRGIISALPEVIGAARTITTMNSLLGDRKLLDDTENPFMATLVETNSAIEMALRGTWMPERGVAEIRKVFTEGDKKTRYSQSTALRQTLLGHSHYAPEILETFLRIADSEASIGSRETLLIMREFASLLDMDRVGGPPETRRRVHRIRKISRTTDGTTKFLIANIRALITA